VLIDGSLQLDESQSLWQSSHSVLGTLHAVALDVHVPLYLLILHFWQQYMGNSISKARILSVVFFLLTIPVFYLLARQILSTGWALFATVVFSFSPFMNWYANVARMYTLLALFATLSQYYFIKLLKRKKVWARYGLTSIVGAYSHYFFSFNLVAEGIFFLLYRKHFEKKALKKFIIVAVLVIATLGPWLLYFHSLGSAANTRPLLSRPSTVDFFNAYSQFLFGFQDNYINTILLSCWPILMLVGLLAVRREQKLTPEIGFIATMAFVPVLMAFLLSYVVSPFFISRYLISSVAPLIIFLVWLISYYGRRLRVVIAVLVSIIILLTSIQQAVNPFTPVKENYEGAVGYINQNVKPQDVVVLSAPFTIYPVEYYYRGEASLHTLPMWNRISSGSIPSFNPKTLASQVNQINANHNLVYLLLSYNQGYENQIKQYYLHHFYEVSSHLYSPDLTLYVFKVGYNQFPPIGSPSTQVSSTQAKLIP
jgi:mannosyltransferase